MRCMFDEKDGEPCHYYNYSPGRQLCELSFGTTSEGSYYDLPYGDWQTYVPVVKDPYDRETMKFKGQPFVFINNYKLKSGQK